jgi:heme-degrading monooxygenase HmoA/GNAT superfamily N-acetyltransferase
VAWRGNAMTPEAFGMWVTFRAQPGRSEELVRALLEADGTLSKVDGCLVHVVSRSAADVDEVCVFETWATRDAHTAWRDSDRTKAIGDRVASLVTGAAVVTELRVVSGKGFRELRHQFARTVTVRIDNVLEGIDWAQAKADLAADDFDNGRSAEALRRSFHQSQHVAIARDGDRIVGMARLLSDGVCNAYLVDVWTASAYRRQGIASSLVRLLLESVPGQHVGLQTNDAQQFYGSLGFQPQPEFWSRIVGGWLDNDANL